MSRPISTAIKVLEPSEGTINDYERSASPLRGSQGGQIPPMSTEKVLVHSSGPLLNTGSGNQHVMVITDRFSNFTSAFPLNHTTSENVAQSFVDDWAMAFGIPKTFLNDNGP